LFAKTIVKSARIGRGTKIEKLILVIKNVLNSIMESLEIPISVTDEKNRIKRGQIGKPRCYSVSETVQNLMHHFSGPAITVRMTGQNLMLLMTYSVQW